MGIVILLLAAVPAFCQNLLPDPGFEEGKWEVTNWDAGEGKHEFSSPGRTGDKCVHLVGTSAKPGAINRLAISPVLPVQPGAYLLSVWYRTTEGAVPTLSFISYTEPFATAQWKSAKAQYVTQPLDTSTEWRLGLWPFTVAQGAIEMRVLLRMTGVGEVWFDDASLVRAEDYGMEPLQAGALSALPDARVFAAKVKAPAGDAWRLSVSTVAGAELGSTPGEGPQEGVSVAFAAAEGLPLRAMLLCGDAPVAVEGFVAPPLAELALETCRYRNCVYASAKPEALQARLTLNATGGLRAGLQYRARLAPVGAPALDALWAPVSEAQTTLSLPAAGLTPGVWAVEAEVKWEGGETSLASEVKVLPPGAPHEVVIDDDNRLLADGKPLFPRGFYGVPPNADQARPTVEAGYNTALTYATDPAGCRKWLDMCQSLGLWGIVSVPRPFIDNYDEVKLREALRGVKDHPALLAYYIIDEPSPTQEHQKPEEIQRVYDVTRDEDPYHPVVICICTAALEQTYINCYDVLMIDVYPVTDSPQPLTTIADRMDHAWAATEGRKPVWFIPQTFGWDVVKGLEGAPTWRTPTPAQSRVMHYLSLAHGARGSIPYCYHVYTEHNAEAKKAGKWPWVLGGYLPDKQPELWASLAEQGEEYATLEQALLQPRISPTVAAEGMVHAGWYWGKEGAFVVAVNADDKQAHTVQVTPPEGVGTVGAADLLLGTGEAMAVDGKLSLTLPPMQTALVAVKP